MAAIESSGRAKRGHAAPTGPRMHCAYPGYVRALREVALIIVCRPC